MKTKVLDILLILSLIWFCSRFCINLEKETILNMLVASWGSIPLLIFLIYNWILMFKNKRWVCLISGIIISPVTIVYYFIEGRKLIQKKEK